MPRALCIVLHADSKVGKSWLGNTAPAPRLILDAEGGNEFTPGKKTYWDPTRYAPPENDGTWETCIVYVNDYDTVLKVYDYLNQGVHPFNSVILDSISEIQQRCVDSIAGVDQMRIQDWGTLLRKVSSLVRSFRDLRTHPTHPLEAIVIIAMTRQVNGKWKPYVQGQLATSLPYYVDVIGYLFIQRLDSGEIMRRLLVSPHDQFEAGERVGGRLGAVVDNPNITVMLDTVYGQKETV